MIQFTISEDSFPYSFFEEINFSFENIAIGCIKKKFPKLSQSELKKNYDDHDSDFDDILKTELKESHTIMNCWIDDTEVDEGSGSWGYSTYEIENVGDVKLKLEEEVTILIQTVVEKI
jgi:hypothetical protein